MMHPAVSISLLLVAGVLGMAGLRVLRDFHTPEPEVLRKALHVWSGTIALAFPWLFYAPWPPVVIAALGSLILFASRRSVLLGRWLGGIVDGVDRRTHGEFYFLAAVAALFFFAGEIVLLYVAPLLVLVFADTAAALVGKKFGRHVYVVAGARKSFEGSGAFFAVATLCIYVALAQTGAFDGWPAVGCAAALALVAAAVEGLSPLGLDNLTVPFSVFVLLRTFFPA